MNNAASPSYNEIYRQINSINTQLQNIQQNVNYFNIYIKLSLYLIMN